MITGGYCEQNGRLDSAEIVDTQDGSVTMASPMNFKRRNHGIGVFSINGKNRLTVFGGDDGRKSLDSIELYNTQPEKWETTHLEIGAAK